MSGHAGDAPATVNVISVGPTADEAEVTRVDLAERVAAIDAVRATAEAKRAEAEP